MTPKGWFRRHTATEESMLRSGHYPSSAAKPKPGRKKRLILSQSMVVDVDVNKACDHSQPELKNSLADVPFSAAE